MIEEIKKVIVSQIKSDRDKILMCMKYLTDQELWTDFNRNLVSPGNLLLHLTGNITQYIISGLGKKPFIRERVKEFRSKPGYTRTELIEQFNNAVNSAIDTILLLDQDAFMQVSVIQGKEITGAEALFSSAAHFSYHTGQLVWIIKNFKNRDLSFYKSADLNKQNII